MINKLSKYEVCKFGTNIKLKFLVHTARSRIDHLATVHILLRICTGSVNGNITKYPRFVERQLEGF